MSSSRTSSSSSSSSHSHHSPLPLPFLIVILLFISIIPNNFISPVNADASSMLCLVNKERKSRNLPLLLLSSQLTTSAQNHAKDMYDNNYLSHTSRDGTSFDQRIRNAGYTGGALAENIAKGQSSEADVMKDWMNSPGHRANILGDYTDFGSGNSGDAWVQDFGKRSGIDTASAPECPSSSSPSSSPSSPATTSTPTPSSTPSTESTSPYSGLTNKGSYGGAPSTTGTGTGYGSGTGGIDIAKEIEEFKASSSPAEYIANEIEEVKAGAYGGGLSGTETGAGACDGSGLYRRRRRRGLNRM